MNSILVSVIIPAYNAEKTLEKCVESVLKQTYQQFEIIIVNDGSKDNTFAVCEELKKRDRRVLVIHQENGGSSAARNVGINKSKGEYLVFIDGDDTINNHYLEKLIEPASKDNVDVVMCGITICYQKQNYSVENGFKKQKIAQELKDVPQLIYESCENGMIYSPCNKLYRKEIISDNKLHFTLNKEPIEDIVFNCEFLRYVRKIAVVPECLYYYNKNDVESNVTRYRKNIWELSLHRSEAIQSLFDYWKMNSEQCMRWLALEYVGGKSDCISNCYRVGSELNFAEKVKLFEKYILNDAHCYRAFEFLNETSLHYDKKILSRMIKVKNPILVTMVYNILFWCRYRLKKIYYAIRRKSQKK